MVDHHPRTAQNAVLELWVHLALIGQHKQIIALLVGDRAFDGQQVLILTVGDPARPHPLAVIKRFDIAFGNKCIVGKYLHIIRDQRRDTLGVHHAG